MKNPLIITVVLFILSSSLFAENSVFKIAPVNPELSQYLSRAKRGALKKSTTDGYPLGYIPHSVKYSVSVDGLKKSSVLPERFDLRDEGKLTTVKDQSTCGACWTFATYGSVESRWLSLGEGVYDLSEQNLKNGSRFNIDHCDGGNASISTAYFVRGFGPILEKDDPYDVNNGDYVSGLTPAGYIPDFRQLPNDAAVLKETLMNYGALYTTMYWDNNYYNAANNTYFFNASSDTSINHAVLLTGWDDNIETDGGKGAWIIRNSWGTVFGDSGFFYISYNDVKINSSVAYWPNKMEYNKNASIFLIDTLGLIQEIGTGDPVGYGLVKYEIPEAQEITKIGVWVGEDNTKITIEIYDSFNGSLSGKIGSVEETLCTLPGYYTFDLNSAINITEKNDIYIKVKYDSPGHDYIIPIEAELEDYASPDITSNRCWLSADGENGQWMAIGKGTDYEWDLCINAYAVKKATAIENDNSINKPTSFMLRNYPNPFNPSTVINYNLPSASDVQLTVFDIMGKEIRTLVNRHQQAGEYKVTFDASNLANGVYFYKLSADNITQVRKMILMK
jgi:C1A family cysteine protease